MPQGSHEAGWRAVGVQRLRTFGRLLAETWREFSQDDGGTRAAAIGYYGLFSLFPLTVLLALALFYLNGGPMARIQVLLIVGQYLPIDLAVLDGIVQRVLENRATLSLVAIAALLWGAIQIFRVLERAINRAWGAPRPRNFLRNLRFALVMISVMGVLTLITLALTTFFELAQPLNLPIVHWAPLKNPLIWAVVSSGPPFLLMLALFAMLYRYVPHHIELAWSDVLPGALLAALIWELAKQGFAFYLANFARQNYDLLYGSLGVVLALLTWVYLTGYIIVLGAEFCAVWVRHHRSQKGATPTPWRADET